MHDSFDNDKRLYMYVYVCIFTCLLFSSLKHGHHILDKKQFHSQPPCLAHVSEGKVKLTHKRSAKQPYPMPCEHLSFIYFGKTVEEN